MLAVFHSFLRGVSWLAQRMGGSSPYLVAAAIPVAISLFHTSFNLVNTLVMVWFVKPIASLVSRIIPERTEKTPGMEEPKYLNRDSLKYPQTAIVSLERESVRLFEHTIVEIVAHALHLRRTDIFSERKARKVVAGSRENLQTDVRGLYQSKVKHIYSQIVAYIIQAQNRLELTPEQHKRVMELYSANRKMVEVIRDARELNRNVTRYLGPEYPEMAEQYGKLRKMAVKILRAVRNIQVGEHPDHYFRKMQKLSETAEAMLREGDSEIDRLIREDRISPEQASSLVNDTDNMGAMIQNLIIVAELLYGRRDALALPELADPARDAGAEVESSTP